MSWNNIESNWKNFKTTVQQQWPSLTDEDLNKINGNRDLLISTIQEKYASSRSDAQTEVEKWQKNQTDSGAQQDLSDSKYNPDYSGSDSNLTQQNNKDSKDKKPGSISNPSGSNGQESLHEEKSIDQT